MGFHEVISRAALAFVVAVSLAACAGGPRVYSSDDRLAFTGLNDLVSGNDNASVRLFAIHGMKTHVPEEFRPLVASIATRMKMSCNGELPCVPFPDESISISVPGSGGKAAVLDKYILRPTLSGQRGIEIYALTWSPLTTQIKQDELREDKIGKRAVLNKYLKDEIFKDGFGDAVLYTGTYGAVLRETVQHALCYFADGVPTSVQNSEIPDCNYNKSRTGESAAAARGPTALISASLGSIILYDSLTALNRSGPRGSVNVAAAVAGNTNHLYMFANQVTLLQLSRYRAEQNPVSAMSGTTAPNAAAKLVLDALQVPGDGSVRSQSATKLQVVAFSDPNDLLSFQFPMDPSPDARFLNVYSQIAFPWLNLMAWPTTAHTGHSRDDTVMELLICGAENGAAKPCGHGTAR